MAPLRRDHRRNFGVNRCAQCQVCIVRDTQVILPSYFKPVHLIKANVGDQKTAFRAAIGADREAG